MSDTHPRMVPYRQTQARYLAVDFLLSVFEPVIGRAIPLVTDDTNVTDFFENAAQQEAAAAALAQRLGEAVDLRAIPVWRFVDELRERFPDHPDLNAAIPVKGDAPDDDAGEPQGSS